MIRMVGMVETVTTVGLLVTVRMFKTVGRRLGFVQAAKYKYVQLDRN